ncbi:TMEM165/GDT1 family protein [Sphingomonas sp.]|uniref:TMEM165/GDT1 family protein n=1 Tax=Sphingomonas sp. TaxID=28214 RepID=UPI002D801588|nr:TMEM165/GDT1 family protein [Sphingomonas sp.]HEU0043214.1 TMEM165/GDT1 family protein [Sphingomonas sp.]
MAALVAVALAQVGDRPAHLAAILADRYRAPGLVIVAALLALAAASGIAAAGGALIAPIMTPEARQLLLALALLLQGGGALWRGKPPERLAGWKLGAFPTSLLGLFILFFGDGVMFVVLALAARSEVPALAALGATLGALAVVVPAVLLGEAAWTRLPLVTTRRVIGALFVVASLWLGMGALRLV